MNKTYSNNLMEQDIWQRLMAHREMMNQCHISDLFTSDPERASRYSIEDAGLFVDYSKHRITGQTVNLLYELAETARLTSKINRLFAGEKLNTTENRPALHTALRSFSDTPLIVDGQNIREDINHLRHKMKTFVNDVIHHRWLGFTQKPITDIVNIGIGGSYLGPKMVCSALKPYAQTGLNVHFLSHLDADQFESIVGPLNPETTLFIVSTKSGTTQETMMNAKSARTWFLSNGGHYTAMIKHFVAVTVNCHHFTEFGIPSENCFPIWYWVGGRYSLWGATGLPIALAIGYDHFESLLSGAQAMDDHFRDRPFSENLPVILALLGVWYINFFDSNAHLIAPYDHLLRDFPNHLQQVEMESNGKQATIYGTKILYPTVPVIWGESGLEGQHAYFQVLHQGSPLIPVDFIASLSNHSPNAAHQQLLLANCFAQSEALVVGRTETQSRLFLKNKGFSEEDIERLIAHYIFEGNRPSTTILMDMLTPKTLGALIALYEHKVFVQSVIWQTNSFDQMGVELGKPLAQQIATELRQGRILTQHDSSTNQLILKYLTKNPILRPVKATEQP